jgi:hypothetical protein
LPAFTPAPSEDSLDSYGRSQQQKSSPSYDTSFLGGGSRNFPIVSLLPAESQNLEEEETFISFASGPEGSLPASEYQNTGDSANLARDVASGSVYVQQQQQQQLANDLNDELYYIYYQDPDQDPNFGAKNKPVRAVETLDAASIVQEQPAAAVAPAPDLPLYDYDEAALGEMVREAREQPEVAQEQPDSAPYKQQLAANYRPLAGTSSVSFNLNVGGRSSGFSYNL